MTTETERARAALAVIPPNLPRDEWHKIGRAGIAAGLSIDDIDKWSATAENYKGRIDVEAAFRTIQPSGGTGAATLFYTANQYGHNDTRGSRPTLSPTKIESIAQKSAPSNAVNVWSRCVPAEVAHGYIKKKQGKLDGLRVYPASAPLLAIRGQSVAGYLVVPCWDGNELQTLQFIPPEQGDKLNLPGAQFNNGYFTVGEIDSRFYICEGLGQAWAINQTTGCAAVVCFGAGRMMTVTKVLRDKFPAARLVIVPDKGKEADATKIAREVSGLMVTMPDDKPGNYDANDYLQEAGADALAASLERAQAPLMRFNLLSGNDLCNAPPMRWMVRGVLPMEGLSALFGASGSGKSFLMLDIAATVAGGDYEWFGRRVSQCPVTYICLEGEAGMGKRVEAWSRHHNRPVPDALRFVTQPFDLLSNDVPELAKAVIAVNGGGLVILDTLNRAAPGADENSSVDMGNLIAAAKKLQNLTGGLVLLVHHTGKDTTRGLRGHSSLYAALDGAIEVTAANNRKAWSVAKCKDDVTGEAHSFKLEGVHVGIDDDGEEITSCVAVPDDSAGEIKLAKIPILRSNQKIANDVVAEALLASPHTAMEGAPQAKPCLKYSDALAIVAERIPTDSKHKTSRAKDAITGLVKRGILASKGDWLWSK